ncbi:RHS repeat-associated core domain-containing protein [Carboxylicivirga sediminis]|uniref:RHS repeat-associated core domain-containing protein n=1 Tax=Carboxylicivirga sediminis TaxID=2006564 RepID=A0A941F2J2_9BACT|nr:RHS repeat-associated core domain-containing protein [Carboxylicivirga sediminis]MBR8534953.1 RHS repeat-associated core domain-containing protein [Carboxylicivirga sediminis]
MKSFLLSIIYIFIFGSLALAQITEPQRIIEGEEIEDLPPLDNTCNITGVSPTSLTFLGHVGEQKTITLYGMYSSCDVPYLYPEYLSFAKTAYNKYTITLSYLPSTTQETKTTIRFIGSNDIVMLPITIKAPIPPLVGGSISSPKTSIYSGESPGTFVNTVSASGGSGTIYYQWQRSTNNSTWSNISGATGSSYSPGNLYSKTYFRRKATAGSKTAYSNTITISLLFSPGSISHSQTVDYNSSSPVTLFANVVPSGGSGTYSYQWQKSTDNSYWSNVYNSTSGPSGGLESAPTVDEDFLEIDEFYNVGPLTQSSYYRVRVTSGSQTKYTNTVKVTVRPTSGSIGGAQTINYNATASTLTNSSSPLGGNKTYSYQWQSSTNNSSWSDISGATSVTYSPGAQTNSRYYRRRVYSDGNYAYSSSVKVTVRPTAGSIKSAQTIDYNATPASLTNNSSPVGGNGSFNYQWQSSTDNSSWSNISGANASSYSPGRLTRSIYYRRRVYSDGNYAYTGSVKIKVKPTSGSIGSSQTIDYNATITTLTNSSSPAGGNGSYSYQWQSSNNNSTWSNISGATSSSYGPGKGTRSCYYRRRVYSDGYYAYSSSLKVTVKPTGGGIGSNQTINYNTSSPTIPNSSSPLGGNGSYSYQWQSSSNNSNWSNISGATNSSYFPGTLTASRYYRRKVTSDGQTAYSGSVKIIVKPTAGSIKSAQTINYNATPTGLINNSSPVGGNGSYSYQWQSSSNNSSWSNISGATSSSYSPGRLTRSIYYRRRVYSDGNYAYSGGVKITVKPSAGSISGNQTINYNSLAVSLNSSSIAAGGNGSYSYQWQSSLNNSSWSNISGATSSSYSPGQLSNSHYYRRKVTSDGNSTFTGSVKVTVRPYPGGISGGKTIGYNAVAGAFSNVTPAAGGNSSLNYQWQISTNNTSWSNISGATGSSYSSSSKLTTSRYYRRAVSSDGNTTYTSSVKVIVKPVGGTIAGNQRIDANSIPQTLTNTQSAYGGNGSYQYQWQQHTGDGMWLNIIGATGSTYTPGELNTTFYYRRKVTSDNNTSYSNMIKVGVSPVYAETDMDMNWTETISYSYDEGSSEPQMTGWSKSYTDGIGRNIQSQSIDMESCNAIVSETLYDKLGRGVLNTMAVPVHQSQLSYITGFVRKEDGSEYTAQDYGAVGHGVNTLGWYYSAENDFEPYIDHTDYPFSRVDYSNTQPGATRRTSAPGAEHRMGSGNESEVYAMPASDDELAWMKAFEPTVEHKGLVKTISINADEQQVVSYANSDGAAIASCLVNVKSTTARPYVYRVVPGVNYVDIHLPPGVRNIKVERGTANRVVNLQNDDPVHTHSVAVGGVYVTDDDGGFYRVKGSNDLEVSVTHGSYSHHNLNIYDKGGRLKRSYTPLAIEKKLAGETIDMVTKYTYNSLGWLTKVDSPDEGISQFVYRADGAIRFSQNAEQEKEGRFSYTNYDEFGRPVESGEYVGTITFAQVQANPEMNISADISKLTQRHRTWYGSDGNQRNQSFVEGAVSKTEYDGNITYYSYTYDGNVEWVIRSHAWLGDKKIEYSYDFLGNVTEVAYQRNQSDAFMHYYEYNANQNLSAVYTSNAVNPEKQIQARYYYYPHGPLRRVELANNVQGIDYVYNLNGLLKGINHPELSPGEGPGSDTNDLFALALDYYSDDYKGNGLYSATVGITNNYGGNIAMTRWKHSSDNEQQAYKIAYNKRNYLSEAEYGIILNDGTFKARTDSAYKVRNISYDANGNIKTLNRNGHGDNIKMDKLAYNYQAAFPNRLDHMIDSYGTTSLGDIGTQVAGTYQYNNIGQLIANYETGNEHLFKYDVTGKVKQVTKTNGSNIGTYYYDDAGFRVASETSNGNTYYVRDLSGNIMAIYDDSGNPIEYPIYGSTRIGTSIKGGSTFASYYELTDHLGNVRAVVKGDDKTINTRRDYYPFGWEMKGRLFEGTNYRYGYQGQFAERDEETDYNHFEARLWDSRIGRWLTTDPAGQFASPYLGMGNNPLMGIDPDGREWYVNRITGKQKYFEPGSAGIFWKQNWGGSKILLHDPVKYDIDFNLKLGIGGGLSFAEISLLRGSIGNLHLIDAKTSIDFKNDFVDLNREDNNYILGYGVDHGSAYGRERLRMQSYSFGILGENRASEKFSITDYHLRQADHYSGTYYPVVQKESSSSVFIKHSIEKVSLNIHNVKYDEKAVSGSWGVGLVYYFKITRSGGVF